MAVVAAVVAATEVALLLEQLQELGRDHDRGRDHVRAPAASVPARRAARAAGGNALARRRDALEGARK